MTRRKLGHEELELWQKVTRTTDRLFPAPARVADTQPAPPAMPRPAPDTPQQTAIPSFRVGSTAPKGAEVHQTTKRMRDRLGAAPLNMDARTHGKMARGKLKPEGRIDLHGMTQAQAHPALIGFIQRSHAQGKRLVLVITGKGSPDEAPWPIPRRRGVLRQLVPHWLTQGPVGHAVLQVTPAHIRHGGDGAYYVYLRRTR